MIRALIRRLFPAKATMIHAEEVGVVCITTEWASAEQLLLLNDVLQKSDCKFFKFMTPGTFYAYFRDTSHEQIGASKLIAELSRTGVRMGVGMVVGKCFFSIDSSGSIESSPFGYPETEAKAFDQAMANLQLSGPPDRRD